MTLALAGFLVAMALVDSTSMGTLIIPVWLVLATRRGHQGRVVIYLLTIAAFYLVLGIALAAGAQALVPVLGDIVTSRPGRVVMVVVGVGLVWLSYRIDPKYRAKRGHDPAESSRRWQERITGALSTPGGMVGLAVVAGGIEAASMLPYLAAIGALTAADIGMAATTATLAVYCLVMILPALLILALRLVAARWVDRPLERLGSWAGQRAGSATAWTVGIVGVLVALQGVGGLL
ncbi:GAP family protein [Mumia sp. zg.B53]|uniref:GAP family protein n=1 Tax=Mumia sp. zg.B53 TaxID=2855449 RepID=UPI001C6ED11A|nr:GAP family protein [Mumia sp. zg.B53]MBW9214439.1 GAP family protein [Mumia sp. zg.B53]